MPSDILLGAFLAALAAASWATGAVFARVGMQHMGSTTGTFVSLVAGFVIIMAISLLVDGSALFAVSLGTLAWFALLGSIQFPLGRFLNYNGIRLAGVAPASILLGASPLFAGILAIIFLDEQVTPMIVVGILAVVAGLALVMSERRG
jgi:drug/metabolite transporter (DMT)-like permease